MATAWSHLPNAAAIDRVISHVGTNGSAWDVAWDAVGYAAWDAARDAASDAASDAVWDAARDKVRSAARLAVCDAAWSQARDAAWSAARDAILALIAWDNCDHLLDTDPEQVQILAILGQPAAILLLPAAIALNQKPSKELTHG
jgi:hypothetical protein